MASQLIMPGSKSFSIGNAQNMAFQEPWWGKGSTVRFWGEGGLVKWEDSKDDTYGAMTWQDAAHRTLALSQMVINSHEQGFYSDESYRLQKFIGQMESVIRTAKRFNAPTVKHRPTRVVQMKPIECECW